MSWKCRGETYGCSQFCKREFDTHSGRYKHEQAAMNKSGGLTTNNVGKLQSKSSTSSKEDDTKSNNSKDSRDSRYLGRELDKAERFRQMVSSQSSIQLTKSAMKGVSPVETAAQFFFNKKINDPVGYDTVGDVKKDLLNFPQL